jgi:hypothetical protein
MILTKTRANKFREQNDIFVAPASTMPSYTPCPVFEKNRNSMPIYVLQFVLSASLCASVVSQGLANSASCIRLSMTSIVLLSKEGP